METKTCCICGGMTRVRFEVPANRLTGSDRPFTIRWCDACAMGRLDPLPTPEESAAFHGEAYFATYAGEGAAGEAQDIEGITQRLRAKVAWWLDRSAAAPADAIRAYGQGRRLRICDIGCGNGGLLTQLEEAGHEVIGVEPAEAARARAHAKGLDVRPGTAEHLPSDLPAFDLVTSSHVLEHCLNPMAAMAGMASLLKPGGRLLCGVPNCDSIGFCDYGPAWWHGDVPRHVNFLTAKSLERIAASAGLRLEEVEYAQYMRQFTGGWVAEQQRLWDSIYRTEGTIAGAVTRPSDGRAWAQLLITAVSGAARGYDSVRMTAVLPQ